MKCNQMEPNLEQSSAKDLDLALRLYRRLVFRFAVPFVLGIATMIGLDAPGTYLSPPYGIYVFGEDLGTCGATVFFVLGIAEFWWEGRAIGRVLRDSILLRSPIIGLLSVPGEVLRRAKAIGMERSGLFGPLRPQRKQR